MRMHMLSERAAEAFLHDDVDLGDGLEEIDDVDNGEMIEPCLGEQHLTRHGDRAIGVP